MTRFPLRQAILLLTAIATSIGVLIGLPGVPPLPSLGIWPKGVLCLWIAWRLWRLLAALLFATAWNPKESSS